MYQLVYTSRAKASLTDADVVALASHAATRNVECGLTGLLLYDGFRFIQALEGKKTAVETVMSRIVADRRHDRVHILFQGRVAERAFGSWSLNYKRAEDGCCSEEFLDKVKRGVATVPDPMLQAAFIGFAALSNNRPAY